MEDSYAMLMKAIKKAGSAPLLINIVSKRTRQFQRGAKPLVEASPGMTDTAIAIREYLEDRIGYKPST